MLYNLCQACVYHIETSIKPSIRLRVNDIHDDVLIYSNIYKMQFMHTVT